MFNVTDSHIIIDRNVCMRLAKKRTFKKQKAKHLSLKSSLLVTIVSSICYNMMSCLFIVVLVLVLRLSFVWGLWKSAPKMRSVPPRPVLFAKWCDSSVTLTVPASLEQTWDLFTQLGEHPTWSPWLDEVVYHPNTGTSLWSLSTFGFTFSWRAQNVEVVKHRVLSWESLDGLPNRGRVEFTPVHAPPAASSHDEDDVSDVDVDGHDHDHHDAVGSAVIPKHTELRLTISYDLPDAAAAVIEHATPISRVTLTLTLTPRSYQP